MAGACRGCNGMGFLDGGAPCPSCGTPPEDARHTFEVAEATRKAAPKAKTVEGVDGPVRPGAENEVGTDAVGAGFSPAAVARQAALDREAMQRDGM
jgi:hypothetical protein